MIGRLFLLLFAFAPSAIAQTVSWAGPTTAVSTVSYTMSATAPANFTIYKNGQYFASGSGYVGSSTTDTGYQTVYYTASGYSYDGTVYYNGSRSVSITAGSPPTVSVGASPSTMYPNTPFTASISVTDVDGDLHSWGIRYQGVGQIGLWLGGGYSSSGSVGTNAHSTVGAVVRIRGEVWDNNGHGVTGSWEEYTVQSIPTSFSFSGGPTFTYDGSPKSISVSATPSGATYSTSGTYSATNAGSYTASATATGDYSGTGTRNWTINQANQSSVSSTNASRTIGQSFTPSYSGGSGTGAWRWHVSGHTSWMSGSWTPPSVGSYTFYVYRLGDSNYLDSSASGAYTLTVNPAPDTTAPSVPSGLSASGLSTTSFSLSWSASSDNVGVAAYEVRRDSTSLGEVGSTSKSVGGLSAGTGYSMTVRARDAANNWSGWSSALAVTTLPAAPGAPTAQAATNVLGAGFTANWSSAAGATTYRLDVSTSSTFSSFVSGYQNISVGNVTSYAVSGLSPSTTYYYRIRAENGGGTSANSATITATTAADNDTANQNQLNIHLPTAP